AVPAVSATVTGVSEAVLSNLPDHGNLRAFFEGTPAIVTQVADTGEPGFRLCVERGHADNLRTALADAGAVTLDDATADAIRIESGVALFHRDMNEETITLEAGIESRGISKTKGCYVGQEVIIRVLHRGHGRGARRLVALKLDAEGAETRAKIVDSDREVGFVTSVATSPVSGPIALGYVHRDLAVADARVSVDTPAGRLPATVMGQPIRSSDQGPGPKD